MVTHTSTNNTKSASVSTASPARRNAIFAGISAALLIGMFSVASASNHSANQKPLDPVATAQAGAVDMIMESGDETTLEALTQLRDSEPKNGIYSYLIAAQHARHGAWGPVLEALRVGNEAPQIILAKSATSSGGYPALAVLRQLIIDCSEAAMRSDNEETSEALLQESAVLAGRIARDATPCDLNVLQSAGSMWRSVDQARIATWEKQERFNDVDVARARLAVRTRWWNQVNEKANITSRKDEEIRLVAAQGLRAKLPQ